MRVATGPVRDDFSTSFEDDELMIVLRSLPSCNRCRSLKKRCDTQLPACANCARFGVECAFFDHVLNEKVSRGYIDSLVRRLEHQTEPSLLSTPSPEYHYVNVKNAFRLVGPHAQLPATIANVATQTLAACAQESESCPLPHLSLANEAGAELHHFLVEKYMSVCQTAYPILGNDVPFLYDLPIHDNEDDWMHFVFNMVLALGCHCLPQNDTRLQLFADSCYNAAQMHFERVMSELNVQALQAVLLLALYSLFDPQKGNIGQQIAFAHRLEVELTERDGEALEATLSRLRRVIFCLGTQVSAVLDRSVGFHAADLDHDVPIDSTDEASYVYACCVALASARQQRNDAAPVSVQLQESDYSPMAKTTAFETDFLLNADARTASKLLKVYLDDDAVLNILTPHWAFKVAITLLASCRKQERSEHFAMGIRILERCTLKWPNSRALLVALQEFMTSGNG